MAATHANQDLINTIDEFYRKYYHEDIGRLAQKYPSESRTLQVDWMDIYRFDADLADDLQQHGQEFIDYFEEALRLYDLPIPVKFDRANVRVYNLGDEQTFQIGQTRSDHREQYVSLCGQVSKRTEVKPKANRLAFECQRCGTITDIPQSGTSVQAPHECQGCERQGPFEINFDQSELTDQQLIRITEPPERSKGGQGQSIDVILEDDIVNIADAGDRVTVSGPLKLEAQDDNDSLTFEKYLDGQALTVEETDFDEIDVTEYEEEIQAIANGEYGDPIDVFVESLAPKIWGYEDIKEAIILQLFGGTSVEFPDGSRDRGDMHLLLLGDPGCGKSKLLRAVKEIAPRSTYASGKGMTEAGLTAAAVRDDFGDTEWGLEAGALVLADKGVACIDEIDKAKEDAISSLHGALESQKVEISKAGINATLSARTSLLAAGNPKYGRFDKHENIAEQIDLDAPLLSRFDLMFMLTDQPDKEDDEKLARHIVEMRGKANEYTYSQATTEADISDIKPTVPADVLRAYIAHAKQSVHPYVKGDEVQDLIDWYTNLRNSSTDAHGPVPVTARMIEAMCRLAEASASARLSETVEDEDMRRAGRLVMRAMRDVGIDSETGDFDADVIETGISKGQREQMKELKEIIAEVGQEYNKGAPVDVILSEGMDRDWGRRMTEHRIENLKEKGEVYEPREGHLRTT